MIYQKMQNSNIRGVCFLLKKNILSMFSWTNHDSWFLRLQWSSIEISQIEACGPLGFWPSNSLGTIFTSLGSFSKINAALIWTSSKTGLTPPPPPQIFGSVGNFGTLFRKSKFFETFATLLGILIHPTFWQKKVSQKLLNLVKPPTLSTKNSKKCPKFFGLLWNPPTPLWTKSKLKLHFFQEALLPPRLFHILPDFLLQKPKSGFNSLRLPCGKPGICSDNSCGTHSLRFLKPDVWLTVEKP